MNLAEVVEEVCYFVKRILTISGLLNRSNTHRLVEVYLHTISLCASALFGPDATFE